MVLDDPFRSSFSWNLLSRADWREVFHMLETEETSILRDLVCPDVHRECNGDNKDRWMFKPSPKRTPPPLPLKSLINRGLRKRDIGRRPRRQSPTTATACRLDGYSASSCICGGLQPFRDRNHRFTQELRQHSILKHDSAGQRF
jgi:hypothetical protein